MGARFRNSQIEIRNFVPSHPLYIRITDHIHPVNSFSVKTPFAIAAFVRRCRCE